MKNHSVIYLLHGYDGRYSDWIKKMPSLKEYASLYNVLIVCPDGGHSSWYVNSPIDKTIQFETFIVHELVDQIDQKYKTLRNRNHRAITGLSMGGHGAIMLGLKHPDIFGAAGSMSGLMELKKYASEYELMKRLGDTINYAAHWKKNTVLDIADSMLNFKINLLIDCGIGDRFINGNRALHKKLLDRSVSHVYVERSGGHSWEYWINAVPYHFLFFRQFFDASNL